MPERDAVREALVVALRTVPHRSLYLMADRLRVLVDGGALEPRIADALLSRPAADVGEAVATGIFGAWSEFISRVVFYARATARSKGYALAVHGSLFRDLDVVAVPWTADACSAQELAEAIHETLVSCEVAFGWAADCANGQGHEKPNGRMAWSITLSRVDGPAYLDLSVAPIVATPTASAPQVTPEMVGRGVDAWLEKINESHSLARMEHEMGRDEVVRAILTAALSATPETGR